MSNYNNEAPQLMGFLCFRNSSNLISVSLFGLDSSNYQDRIVEPSTPNIIPRCFAINPFLYLLILQHSTKGRYT